MASFNLPLCSSLILFIVVWASVPCLAGENFEFLELVKTQSRLPTASNWISAVYDGQDSIYVLGGWDGNAYLDQVVRYSLDSDLVTTARAFTPINGGAVVMANDEEILYYGGLIPGSLYSNRIYSYSVRHENYSIVATLPATAYAPSVAWDSANQIAYLIGGNNAQRLNTVIRHNVNTNQVDQVGTLPVAITRATAIWVPNGVGGVAYNFGGYDGTTSYYRQILQFDPINGNVTILPVSLPNDVNRGCSVFIPNQGEAYIFGYTSPLLRFEINTHSVEALQVEGWPLKLIDAGCVYVPKLKRIYIFGGHGRYAGEPTDIFRDEISYVELDIPETTDTPPTEEPTTEGSVCPPEGVYNFPYPGNCTLYIRCFHGVPQILSCYPLRFDTNELICKPVAEAFCDQEDSPTTATPVEPTTPQPEPGPCPPIGYEVFPHESNCSKYIECNGGVPYESDCAANTYFDIHHEIRRCNQAELATCNAECPVFGIDFQPIRASGCRWYKICIEGSSTNLECGAGTRYDPQLQKCVPEQDYNCPYMVTI